MTPDPTHPDLGPLGALNGHGQTPDPTLPGITAPERGPKTHPLANQLIGGIDVGSNAMRLKLAQVTSTGGLIPVLDYRESVRLGADVFRRKEVGPAALRETIEAFQRFQSQLESYGVTLLRAVGTSALREAENSIAVIDRIAEQTGILVEVISPLEEAQLVVRAVTRAVEDPAGDVLIIDVGGGSVEIAMVQAGRILAIEGFQVGTVRVLQYLAEQGGAEADYPRLIDSHLAYMRSRLAQLLKLHPVTQVVAIGGNAGALADLAAAEGDAAAAEEGSATRLTLTQLRNLQELIDSLATQQRVMLLGLPERRADVIQPAVHLYRATLEAAGLTEMAVPGVGVRDGLLWEMVDPHLAPEAVADPDEQIYQMAMDIGDRFRFDQAHAEQVARLCGCLFDDLTELHRLPRNDRYLLIAAALLHDVGHLVNHGKHHVHSYYLIRHADFYGLSPREQELVALISRFHRKGDPEPGRYPEFAALSHQDRVRVTKLAAILRVGDALDRTHTGAVENLKALHSGNAVVLQVSGPVDITIEGWALNRKAALFKRVFLTDLALEAME